MPSAMTDFLQSLFLASLFTYGIRSLFSYPNILHGAYQWLEPRVPEILLKPTISCYQCMSSFWGFVWFFLFLPEWEWYYVIIFMICLCGLNSIVDHAIN